MGDRGGTSKLSRADQPLPVKPIAAVIGVVFRDGEVLLVRRANPPDAGKWGFPGGKIESGEPIQAAAVREVLEETGVVARPLQVFTAVDAFDRDQDGRVLMHYVLVAVLCDWLSGVPEAADDALEAGWVSMAMLGSIDIALSFDVERVASMAARVRVG